MDDEAQVEQSKYDAVWGSPEYNASPSPGVKSWPTAWLQMNCRHGDSIIDFGCGAGQVVDMMAGVGLRPIGIDISMEAAKRNRGPFLLANLWELPTLKADWGFCADVLEHIPTDRVDAVLSGIDRSCVNGVYLQIALFDDYFGPALIGTPLHLTVKPVEWWLDKIRDHWSWYEAEVRDEYLLIHARVLDPKHPLAP